MEAEDLFNRAVAIGEVRSSVEVRRDFHQGNAQFACAAPLAATAEDLPVTLSDPTANWVYARFMPSLADVGTVAEANRRMLVSGEEIATSAAAALRAYQTKPAALLHLASQRTSIN